MKDFEHIIITRFNVSTEYSQARQGITSEWLNHRFQLFEDFCYPSVYAQSNQEFKWLVYFDIQTPAKYKKMINEYAQWNKFIPIYVSGEFSDAVNRTNVLKILSTDSKYLITTRLDNDDSISKDFVEIIQNNFCSQKMEFINLTNGYVFSESKLYLFKYSSNPFISLIEKINDFSIDGFKTVFCGDHTQLSSLSQVRQVATKPTWMQVIHGKNVSNRIRGIRQPLSSLDSNFVINTKYISHQEGLLPYLLDRSWTLMKYPIDSMIISLPKDARNRLKKLLKLI